MSESVKVAVRCRPLNEDEKRENEDVIAEVNEQHSEILLKRPKTAETKLFTFDYAFGPNSS